MQQQSVTHIEMDQGLLEKAAAPGTWGFYGGGGGGPPTIEMPDIGKVNNHIKRLLENLIRTHKQVKDLPFPSFERFFPMFRWAYYDACRTVFGIAPEKRAAACRLWLETVLNLVDSVWQSDDDDETHLLLRAASGLYAGLLSEYECVDQQYLHVDRGRRCLARKASVLGTGESAVLQPLPPRVPRADSFFTERQRERAIRGFRARDMGVVEGLVGMTDADVDRTSSLQVPSFPHVDRLVALTATADEARVLEKWRAIMGLESFPTMTEPRKGWTQMFWEDLSRAELNALRSLNAKRDALFDEGAEAGSGDGLPARLPSFPDPPSSSPDLEGRLRDLGWRGSNAVRDMWG